MEPNSEINEVHTAPLQDEYRRMATYLRDPSPAGRRSYREYLGQVYELDDERRSVTFQSECLLPKDDRGRPRVLLLFSNAHPESIRNGMFHTAEGRVAALWTDLCHVGLFSAHRGILESPAALRRHCIEVAYDGPFTLGFACYWLFPTFHPKHLRQLFKPNVEPPDFEGTNGRLNGLLAKWRPKAIISFNGKVFKALTDKNTKGYTKRLRRGTLEGKYRALGREYPVFQTYPTGWRYASNATELRRVSLRRIASAIRRLS